MANELTATVVETRDIVLAHDKASRKRNLTVLKRLMKPGLTKLDLKGTVRLLGGANRRIHLEFHHDVGGMQPITVATAGKDCFNADESRLEETDHFLCASPGGNARNETEHLNGMFKAELLRRGPPLVIRHPVIRKIFQITTTEGTFSVGDSFPKDQDLSVFVEARKPLLEGYGNITDHSLAKLFGDRLGEGPLYFLNPTSSRRRENGAISALFGRAPALSIGLREILQFLGGAARSDARGSPSGNRSIFPSVLTEDMSIPYFQNGVLNPIVLKAVDLYGWQYSELLYKLRPPAAPCDIVLTAGPSGGALRMGDYWAFSSVPTYDNERVLGQRVHAEQVMGQVSPKVLTDFNAITNSAGCGDAAAAIQAYVSSEQEDIRTRLGANLAWYGNRSKQVQGIAELIHASILMRVYALLVYHTEGTTLAHLSPSFMKHSIHVPALEDAAETARDIDPSSLRPSKPLYVRARKSGVSLAIWRQGEDWEWATSPDLNLRGVNRDPDVVDPAWQPTPVDLRHDDEDRDRM